MKRTIVAWCTVAFTAGFAGILALCLLADSNRKWYEEMQKPSTRLGAFIIWDHGPIRHYDVLETARE